MQFLDNDPHSFGTNTLLPPASAYARSMKHLLVIGAFGALTVGAAWASEPAVSALERYTPTSGVCGYIELAGKIDSSSSGAWDVASRGAKAMPRLALVDAIQERILGIEPDGQLQTLAKSGLLIPSGATPSRLRANDGLLVVQDQSGARMLNLTPGSAGFESFVYRTKPKPWPGPEDSVEGLLYNIFDWTLLDLDPERPGSAPAFAGMGDLKLEDGTWKTVFVTFDTAMNGSIFALYGVNDSIAIRGSSVDYPYFATVRGKAYVLLLQNEEDGGIRIGEVEFGSTEPRWLTAFPQELRKFADIAQDPNGRIAGPELALLTLRSFENSATLAGIYGAGDRLFVMFKEAFDTQSRTTRWWLHELDPESGESIARYPVPSTEAHLTAVAGDVWAFLEKSAVFPVGPNKVPIQNTLSLVTIDMDRLPELGRNSADHCLKIKPNAPTKEGRFATFLRRFW